MWDCSQIPQSYALLYNNSPIIKGKVMVHSFQVILNHNCKVIAALEPYCCVDQVGTGDMEGVVKGEEKRKAWGVCGLKSRPGRVDLGGKYTCQILSL